jgi:hypothetical protein
LNSPAQVKLSPYFGKSFPSFGNLNSFLTRHGFNPLTSSNNCVGVNLSMPDEYVELIFDGFISTQEKNYNANKGYSFRTGGIALSMGWRGIKKEKYSITPSLGVTWNPVSILQIRNGNPPNGATPMSGQLLNPTNQLIEFMHIAPFYLNIGVQTKLNVWKIANLGLKVSYQGRLSKSKWSMSGQSLSEAPAINPLGFQTALLVSF